MGIKKNRFLKSHNDKERENKMNDSKHKVAVTYSEINELKLYIHEQVPDPQGPLAIFQRRKNFKNQGGNCSYSGCKARVAYALLVDKINGTPMDSLQVKFHMNQEQANLKSNQTKFQNIFRLHFNQKLGNHDFVDDDDDNWSIESTDQCCFVSRRKKSSGVNLRCLLSCHQLQRSKSYQINTTVKNPTERVFSSFSTKKFRKKFLSSNLLIREKDKVSSTLDDEFTDFNTSNTNTTNLRDVLANSKDQVDDADVIVDGSNIKKSMNNAKIFSSNQLGHDIISTKFLSHPSQPGHMSKKLEEQNLPASTKIKIPKISSKQSIWASLDTGGKKLDSVTVCDDQNQIIAKKTASEVDTSDTKPTKSDSKKGNFFNFVKFSTAVNCFSPDIIRDSKVPPVPLLRVDPSSDIYIGDIGLTRAQCNDIIEVAERCCQGRYTSYTYAKQTLGCKEYFDLALICKAPTLVACSTIRHYFGATKRDSKSDDILSTPNEDNDNDNKVDNIHSKSNNLEIKGTTHNEINNISDDESLNLSGGQEKQNKPRQNIDLVLDNREPHVVKYDTLKADRRKLDMHTDKSKWTFIVALSQGGGEDYDGGGTYFECCNTAVHLQQGQVLIFPGKLKHRGEKITKGVRYLLVGFLVEKPIQTPSSEDIT